METVSGGVIASNLEVVVKWYDPKRGFGFCVTAEPTSGTGAIRGSLPRSVTDQPFIDLFLGAEEAAAGKARGLSLARGEHIICDIEMDTLASKSACSIPGDGSPDSIHHGHCSGSSAGATSKRPLRACQLRPLHGNDASDASEHAAALDELEAAVRKRIAPALCNECTFREAAHELRTSLQAAWDLHAAVGRERLESFVQGPCFEAVQAFGRQALLASDFGEAEAAAEWLGELGGAPWCWSPQQRRVLGDLQGLARDLHAGGGAGAGHDGAGHDGAGHDGAGHDGAGRDAAAHLEGPDPADEHDGHGPGWLRSMEEGRTSRFVVVLEGVRNSANQQMIFRTCEALGVDEVWLVPPPAGTKYRAAMRRSRHASRGADRFLLQRRLNSAAEVAARCREDGRELWVTHCPPEAQQASSYSVSRASGCPLPALTHCDQGLELPCTPLAAGFLPEPPRLALVLGTEGEGVSGEMLGLAARAVFLPMYGVMQSLNVAVACGMLLQRLFDACPGARGDLGPAARAAFRARASGAARCREAADAEGDGAGEADG